MSGDMDVIFFVLGIMVVAFGGPLALKGILKLIGIPHIPKEFEADKAEVVCESNTYMYSFAMLLCSVVGIVSGYGSILNALEGEFVGLMFAFFAIVFMAMAVVFFVIIKNRMILLFTDRIIFRDTFGKVFYYTSQQVVGYVYTSGRNRCIRVRMNDGKVICIEGEGASFYDALDFVRTNYPEL